MITLQMMWVLQRDVGWQQRLWHTAADLHRVEAQTPGKVADKIEAIRDQLRGQKKAGREQRFDAKCTIHRLSFVLIVE